MHLDSVPNGESDMGEVIGTIGGAVAPADVGPKHKAKKRQSRVPRGVWRRGTVYWCRVTAPNGERRRISLGARDPETARLYFATLEKLSDPRAKSGDLIARVFDGSLSVKALYDADVTGRLAQIRADESDPDLSRYVEQWAAWLTARSRRPVSTRQRDDYVRQLRTLIPEGRVFRRSTLTRRKIEEGWLERVGGSTSTRARYFAALRSFVRWLSKDGIVSSNVLEPVEAPSNAQPRSEFWPFEQVQRVLAKMPTPEFRAAIALFFGSGLELSALVNLTAADVVDPANRALLAPGTKTTGRHRYVVVDRWAWPYVESQAEGKIGYAKLFPNVQPLGDNLRDEFYTAQIAAGLVPPLPEGITPANAGKNGVSIRGMFHTIHDCRHTYAVNRMTGDDGEPARDLQSIADNLGHEDLQMVSRIYAKHRNRVQRRGEHDRTNPVPAAGDAASEAS